jgi:hypothetical protein
MAAVALLRFVRPLVASLMLGAPFVAVALAADSGVASISRATTTLLLRWTAPLGAVTVTAPPLDVVPAAPPALVFEAATKTARKGGKAQAKAKPAALFVSEATVLRLAQGAARPRGSFVAASAEHPAGLRLTGVAALGIGLHEGDILVDALGIVPRAPEQIIGAIIEARAKQTRFLSGTLWRQGQTFRITVEQPYLPVPA